MGTRYEDQPVEQWAGPESLDPTPVWKQYILVALLALISLLVLVVVGLAALAPELATPPALVPGDRLVLATSDVASGNVSMKRYGAPLVSEDRAFWLVRVNGAYYALVARWAQHVGDAACNVAPVGGPEFQATCPGGATYLFSAAGDPRGQGKDLKEAARGLDRYLVSVSGDRVIVNLSRVIESSERTSGPVPTGIPQPQGP